MRRGTNKSSGKVARRRNGFSLIELLIVVAIILIIAAIAIPNFIRARMAANESNAVQVCRTLVTASITYSSTYGNGYPPTFLSLGGPGTPASCDQAALIDQTLATPPFQKSGYTFAYTMAGPNPIPAPGCAAAGGNSFWLAAVPNIVGTTGQRSFCSDQSGVIRTDPAGGAIGGAAACSALQPIQ